jgi:ATP-dependent RNA helicase DeaD
MTMNFETETAETTAHETMPVAASSTTAPATTFESLGVPAEILAVLARLNFATPTPIQEQAIPMALNGTDILGSAQTGTGKTAAFTIPMLAHLLKNPASMALIVAPTRELATQIQQAVISMTDHAWRIRCALLIGGDPMSKQMHQLQQNPRIIIGTPGRINDHLKRRSVNLSKVDYLVLDETDRMLDMGFGIQIDQILTYMPGRRQTMLFSATLPPYITKLANKYMQNPQRIAAGSTTEASVQITQETLNVTTGEKYAALGVELEKRGGTIIVFVKTKHGADRLAGRLERDNHNADAIHGDLRQNRRDKVIKNFRAGKTRILVATDVAARGLDIPHIEHVINYDLPQCPEDFIHRIGRTGRAGAEGFALTMISNEDGAKWNAIQRLMNPGAAQMDEGPRSKGKGRGSNGGGSKGGGFKHKQKQYGRQKWGDPQRHRKGGNNEMGPNAGRFQEGDVRPQEARAHKPREERSYQPREKSYDNRGGNRPDRKFESRDRDQQPRENRDRWGNSDRADSRDEGRPQYRPEGRPENRDNGFKKPFKKRFEGRDDNRGDNRNFKRDNRPQKNFGEKPEWKKDWKPSDRNDRPRHENSGQQSGERPARSENFKSGEFKKPFKKHEFNRDDRPPQKFKGERSNLPSYGQESRPKKDFAKKQDGERYVKRNPGKPPNRPENRDERAPGFKKSYGNRSGNKYYAKPKKDAA